ncbi:DAO-domain-containing protein [Trichocladium antarcticum]|uniref:Amine oxidase n=1 Tax=Trichocladium antarcticum TaxID=1450529 RepID=A0AAN6UEF5_9PEZI|nr:DAO-domain-containing protein [Trichocladium antarcticum]
MTIRRLPDDSRPDAGALAQPPAGLPSRHPTDSYWLRDPSPVLRGHRTTETLPDAADVVVVGSGITGAFAARFLKEEEGAGRDAAVVMLEAREACAGATGRNGGHCQPLVYDSVPAVAAFELEVFGFMERLVGEEGVDCDWVSLTGVHAFLSEDMFERAAASVEQLEKSHPEIAAHLEVVRPSESSSSSATTTTTTTTTTDKNTLASLRIPSANGAVIQKKAASLWPYKLVAWVLERLLAKFPAPAFNLQTNTPVTSLARHESGSGWTVTTPRGKISARQVLLATNGYTSRLLPAFSDLIVPVRGQIGALLPPTPQAGADPAKLLHSYVFAADPDDAGADRALGRRSTGGAPRDDYLVQRPLPAGELIYGGGRRLARDLGVGEWRDDELEGGVAEYLRGSLAPALDLTPDPVEGSQGRSKGELKASFEWTGVMGYSRDHHAWVGPVPESMGGAGPEGGLWICAGYTGHGMPAAALSAREVVRQMAGSGRDVGKDDGPRLPREFVLSDERVAMARGMPHLTQGWEAADAAASCTGAGAPANHAAQSRASA